MTAHRKSGNWTIELGKKKNLLTTKIFENQSNLTFSISEVLLIRTMAKCCCVIIQSMKYIIHNIYIYIYGFFSLDEAATVGGANENTGNNHQLIVVFFVNISRCIVAIDASSDDDMVHEYTLNNPGLGHLSIHIAFVFNQIKSHLTFIE